MTRKQAVALADKYFSLYIRARDLICVVCKKKPSDHCAHLMPRGHYATRWNEHNAYGLCMGCHKFFHDHSETKLINEAREMFGEQVYLDVIELYSTITHFKTYQIEEIARYYKKKAEGLG